MIDHLATMTELGQILRGEHPAWEGDSRANGGAFLRRIRNDMPEEAARLALDLERNTNDFAVEANVSPRSVLIAAGVLRGDFLSM